jgi:hypothetical protein
MQSFSQTYAEARTRFLDAARAAGLEVTSHAHPLPGRDGELLAMDVVRDGAGGANRLVQTSACHGVEGFCGSGIQVALLGDRAVRRAAADAGVALLYVHALNPHGFSWWRRVTHENVDLNRNFQDFSRPLPRNAAYDEIAHLIVPDEWPPTAAVTGALQAYIARNGQAALQAAVSGGQYAHPRGIFYGGDRPTWSNRTIRQVLREHGRGCERLAWIDYHTGLGPSGHGERIFAARDDADTLARARAWWGDKVTSVYDGSSTSALLSGMMFAAAYEECPQAQYAGIALEYGTLPLMEVMDALRADQWLQNHAERASPAQRDAIKQRIRDAFYVDTDEWKRRVVEQAREAVLQAIAGLAR